MEVGILEMLKELGDGRVLDDLHGRLQEGLAAVRLCHEKGAITLKISILPTDDIESQRVDIRADIKTNFPIPGRSGATYFVDSMLRLQRRDPRQRELPEVIDARDDLDGKARAAGER